MENWILITVLGVFLAVEINCLPSSDYPGKPALQSYTPARGEFPVQNVFGSGFLSYVDSQGVPQTVNYKPNPLYAVRVAGGGNLLDDLDKSAQLKQTQESLGSQNEPKPLRNNDEKVALPFPSQTLIPQIGNFYLPPQTRPLLPGQPIFSVGEANPGNPFMSSQVGLSDQNPSVPSISGKEQKNCESAQGPTLISPLPGLLAMPSAQFGSLTPTVSTLETALPSANPTPNVQSPMSDPQPGSPSTSKTEIPALGYPKPSVPKETISSQPSPSPNPGQPILSAQPINPAIFSPGNPFIKSRVDLNKEVPTMPSSPAAEKKPPPPAPGQMLFFPTTAPAAIPTVSDSNGQILFSPQQSAGIVPASSKLPAPKSDNHMPNVSPVISGVQTGLLPPSPTTIPGTGSLGSFPQGAIFSQQLPTQAPGQVSWSAPTLFLTPNTPSVKDPLSQHLSTLGLLPSNPFFESSKNKFSTTTQPPPMEVFEIKPGNPFLSFTEEGQKPHIWPIPSLTTTAAPMIVEKPKNPFIPNFPNAGLRPEVPPKEPQKDEKPSLAHPASITCDIHSVRPPSEQITGRDASNLDHQPALGEQAVAQKNRDNDRPTPGESSENTANNSS